MIVACPVLEPYLQTVANENNLHAVFLGVITQSPCAQAPPKISSRDDAPTHRHRYHSMPSMPKGNSSLPCKSACFFTMGLFVMINQPTKNRVLVLLCARAHASVRPVSLIHVLLADSVLRSTTRSQPLVASKMARYFHDQPSCYACFGESPPYNPHRHTSLLSPNALVQRVLS